MAQVRRLHGALDGLLREVKASGALREDVSAADIYLLLASFRVQYPDPGRVPSLRRRYLALLLAGPHAAGGDRLPGDPPAWSDLPGTPSSPPPMIQPMRIFLAGATGVIGVRLLPLLVAAGHTVAGMTRSPGKAGRLRALGAEPVVCDVYDATALTEAVAGFGPGAVVHQLTDLPDRLDELPGYADRNDRIRTEGTRNLLAAARAAGAAHFLAQSIAWRPQGRGTAVDEHERQVLAARGVVARYGQLYGPGTFYENEIPPHPRIHVDAAAAATPPLITAPSGVVTLAEEES